MESETDQGGARTLMIAIILGSVRPRRRASLRGDADYELIDLVGHPLPMLDEPVQPAKREYTNEHTRAWSRAIASFDGYVFITREYKHGPPASSKNAIDYLYAEWKDKAATYVGALADFDGDEFTPTDFAERTLVQPSTALWRGPEHFAFSGPTTPEPGNCGTAQGSRRSCRSRVRQSFHPEGVLAGK